ncbi:serine/threonine protein kinase AMPK catalytic (alpha) subunit Ssp2 [Schizosaccharomyces pombe]|uniref:SNF1-like protein kinase ssp2 n=2 Tax=Schizosaccharomyces pombe TaxID=4896 RepID=SNF1_SCHPO|nr:serine/threonine protein kinase Ssp2 [Schizosaccharomyces pombe]O74536.1 RecName: Full=SNF1-like protein kinase ssp2 [Schizosaccharomyces pombe 972h-]CAA20833.1 serine/threonine protein kinase Ssp2 [Schizosaccharomyces pombe]|eukprot:NP_588376.1 serine/threonine protein kinase Ssp2 [Schizosaccharomyces pombe]
MQPQEVDLMENSTMRNGARVLPPEAISKRHIGPYIIRETLGEGSFGKVKLATHYKTQQKVALKFISRQLLKKSDMHMRVEREISYLKLLRHPHIIKLYDVITTPTDIVMVIEYAGGELFDYIVEKKRMTEDEGRRFFQQIICAIEYCHRHKIVHRDLKPENLLLDDNLNVKIADFGLSNIMTDGNFLKTSCGSPNYAAPEVINGKLYAGPEVDVWSCGIVLYVMLVGRLPFDDEFIPNLFKKVNSCVYVMPDFLSPGAQSLIRRMIVADPMQRITIQEIRRDPWFNVNLPDYLRPMEEVQGSYADSRIVSKLGEAMGFSEDYIVEALRSDENNEVKEAYNLLHENQVIQEKSHLSKSKRVDSFLSVSPPAFSEYTSELQKKSKQELIDPTLEGPRWTVSDPPTYAKQTIDSNICVLVPTAEKNKLEMRTLADAASAVDTSQSTRKKSRRNKWHFGVRCRGDAPEILLAVYRALQRAGAQFTVPKPVNGKYRSDMYTIKSRWEIPHCKREGKNTYAYIELQLYEVMPGCFMLDVKSNGYKDIYSHPERTADHGMDDLKSSFPFLDLCAMLVCKLFSA